MSAGLTCPAGKTVEVGTGGAGQNPSCVKCGGQSQFACSESIQPTLTLHAGEGFLMTPRLPHNALDVGPKTGQMLSTYIVEVGEPLATLVDGPLAPSETSDPESNERHTS